MASMWKLFAAGAAGYAVHSLWSKRATAQSRRDTPTASASALPALAAAAATGAAVSAVMAPAAALPAPVAAVPAVASDAALGAHLHPARGSHAAATEIGSFRAGGMVFKDRVKVIAISDPAVEGVTCHVSYAERALNPFTDPSGSSCSCIRVADTLRFTRPVNTRPSGEDVFSQSKNWMFKSLKVRRVYDPTTHSLVYVSYSDRFVTSDAEARGDRFKTSVSNIRLRANELPIGRAAADDD